jgi:hemerythrin
MAMTRYAQAHFKAEESLMEAYGFPGLEEQKFSILIFVKNRRPFYGYIHWVDHIPEFLLEYLTDWWVHHILKTVGAPE